MENHKCNAFKIGRQYYLLVTINLPKDVTTLKYEILGNAGKYISRCIEGCESENTVTHKIDNIDETFVFKYLVNDEVKFSFVDFKELIENDIASEEEDYESISNTMYYAEKNIQLNIDYCKEEDLSETKEMSDEVEDDLYKPVSDYEGDDVGIATLFHMEDSGEEEADGFDDMDAYDEELEAEIWDMERDMEEVDEEDESDSEDIPLSVLVDKCKKNKDEKSSSDLGLIKPEPIKITSSMEETI